MTTLPKTLTDKQAMFNAAYIGLAGQGFQKSSVGVGDGETCLYRGPNGKKCAIGHCLPDGMYAESDEGLDAETLLRSLGSPLMKTNPDFADTLQAIHDNSITPHGMRLDLEELAISAGLTIPSIDTQEAV